MPDVVRLSARDPNGDQGPDPITWIDIDRLDSESCKWLERQTDVGERVKPLLLDGAKVTRREKLDHGLFVELCGIRHEPNQDHDLVSICLLIEKKRVITVHTGALPAVTQLRQQIERGEGPRTPLELFVRLAVCSAESLENSITEISAETDDVEDSVLAEGEDPPMRQLNSLRYKAFQVRRQLVPLRNLLGFIAADQYLPIDTVESKALAAASEQVVRYLQGLDDCRERAQLLHDQVEGQFAATMTRVSYNLTIVATVFLPLTFITGLLGMNVAGLPEEHDPRGFWIVCASLIVIGAVSWIILRWRKWI